MIPLEKVNSIILRFDELEKLLSKTNIDKKEFVKNSKEYSSIGSIIKEAKEYQKILKDKDELRVILNDQKSDKDLKMMAESELNEVKKKELILEKKIKYFMLPKDEADEKNAIIEIRAGTGGLEASLFASDLFSMYQKVSSKNNWKIEILNTSQSDAGGFKEIIFLVNGKNVFSKLKFESGVHRVQRVPDTETQGRVHTSAATVAVLPEAEDVDIKIDDNDLRIDVFRSSGPGGQSVNTTDSAVRITHLPSKIVVQCQNERSQHKNKETCMNMLKARLYDYEIKKREEENQNTENSKSEIGWGHQIRSYVLQPYRLVKDNRTNFESTSPDKILDGDLDEFLEQSLYKIK